MQAWIPAHSYPNAVAVSFDKQGQQNILILALLFLSKQFMRVEIILERLQNPPRSSSFTHNLLHFERNLVNIENMFPQEADYKFFKFS